MENNGNKEIYNKKFQTPFRNDSQSPKHRPFSFFSLLVPSSNFRAKETCGKRNIKKKHKVRSYEPINSRKANKTKQGGKGENRCANDLMHIPNGSILSSG